MPQTDITIDPKHARLQNFLAGKGISPVDGKPVTLKVSDTELTSLVRKAKEHGFEDLIKVPKGAVKRAQKAKEATGETVEVPEPKDPEQSDETTADKELEADASVEVEGDASPKRRRRTA